MPQPSILGCPSIAGTKKIILIHTYPMVQIAYKTIPKHNLQNWWILPVKPSTAIAITIPLFQFIGMLLLHLLGNIKWPCILSYAITYIYKFWKSVIHNYNIALVRILYSKPFQVIHDHFSVILSTQPSIRSDVSIVSTFSYALSWQV